jgi:Bacterial Ig domain
MMIIRSARSMRAWLCFAATALLAQGCTRSAPTWNGVFGVDLEGAAKTCTAPNVTPPDGLGVKVQVQMTNDGGWCGVSANRNGGSFDSYLLVTRPAHGTVFAHHVGAYTRIDYTPDPGFAGTDSFAVHMIPGDGTVEETVIVNK